jgi:hypothetical protein
MNRFSQWLKQLTKATRSSPRRRSTVQLQVEELEGRSVPALLTYHGGPLITNVQVETVYLGQVWSDPQQLQQTARYLDQYFRWITDSPYMDILAQYGIGHGQFIGSDTVTSAPQSGNLSDTSIRAILNGEIQAGRVPSPTPSRLYFIFTAPNVVVTAGSENSVNDFLGYHWSYTGPSSNQVLYAVIDHPTYPNARLPNLQQVQQLTEVSSHELAEAATDPTSQGWYDNSLGSSSGEIGDLVNAQYGTVNGYVVQKEWSNADNTGILPQDTGTKAWTFTNGYLKLTVAGRGEVFGLDLNNGIWVYRDSSGWSFTNGYGIDLSVGIDASGQDELWIRDANGAVWRYDQGSWTFTGGYLKSILGGQGEVFGLDGADAIWVYRDGVGWSFTNGYGIDLSLGTDYFGTDVLWIRDNTNAVWRYEQGSWFFTGGYLTTIRAGRGEVFGLDSANAIWVFNDFSGWSFTNGYGIDLSVGVDASGQDELWIRDGNNGVWRYQQGSWTFTGGHLTSIRAGQGEVFGQDGNNGIWVWHDTSGWAFSNGYGQSLSIGINPLGQDEAWVLDGRGAVWRYRESGT